MHVIEDFASPRMEVILPWPTNYSRPSRKQQEFLHMLK